MNTILHLKASRVSKCINKEQNKRPLVFKIGSAWIPSNRVNGADNRLWDGGRGFDNGGAHGGPRSGEEPRTTLFGLRRTRREDVGYDGGTAGSIS